MILTTLDWLVIAAYFALNLAIGFFYMKRYSGPPATFLRGFRAVYLAFPVNTIIMGWVNLAMCKILALTLGLDTTRKQLTGVFCCLALTLAYNAVSGLWAVLWTDLLPFILKMSVFIRRAQLA